MRQFERMVCLAAALVVGGGVATTAGTTTARADTGAPAAAADGYGIVTPSGVETFGDGSIPAGTTATSLPSPIAGAAATADGNGYWLASEDGDVYPEGDAAFYGEASTYHAAETIGIATTADGGGYWQLTADGAIYSFGDARYYGGANIYHPSTPVVAIAPTADGQGYWLVTADGAVFSFGDARYYGGANVYHPGQPVTAMTATADGRGYWMATSDGGLFSFGDASFFGAAFTYHPPRPVVGMAASPGGNGYWMLTADGAVFAFGRATYHGGATQVGSGAVGIFAVSGPAGAAPDPSSPATAPTTTTTSTGPAPTATTNRTAAGPASPSVIIQMSTIAMDYTPAELASMVRQICPANVNPTGQVVLQDVADSSGNLLTSYIDAIEPYLPGGSSAPCFGSVYVGTSEPAAWTGPGSEYVEGVENANYTTAWLTSSRSVAQQFVATFPHLKIGWYVTYEANLNELYYPDVVAGYRSLLTSDIASLRALRPGAPVLWSPAFWWQYSSYHTNTLGMTGLAASLQGLFSSLRAVGGLNQIDLQDFVEGSACWAAGTQVTPSDAVNWVKFLQGIPGAPAVAINTEQYSWDCSTGGILDGRAADVQAREAYYVAQGVKLGPAFELRYWLANHAAATNS